MPELIQLKILEEHPRRTAEVIYRVSAHLQATHTQVCCDASQGLEVALQPGAVLQCDAVVPRLRHPPLHDVLSLLVLQLIL